MLQFLAHLVTPPAVVASQEAPISSIRKQANVVDAVGTTAYSYAAFGALRGETTVTLKWIAKRLRMGSWSYVANNLYQSAPRTR